MQINLHHHSNRVPTQSKSIRNIEEPKRQGPHTSQHIKLRRNAS
jgi:hypothetical protein